MAKLPDPTPSLSAADRALYARMAAVRAHADGRATLGNVYITMFNNPGVAEKVGALGEQLRFHGVLPEAVRQLAILRHAAREKYRYVWSHHQREAKLAGVDQATIDDITMGNLPTTLPDATQAVLQAVDAVAAKQSIPDEVQQRIVDAMGTAGVVEIVVLCGLYAMMGDMVISFDIALEQGLQRAPF
jgi:alkylhydroperoxidase family enzyme